MQRNATYIAIPIYVYIADSSTYERFSLNLSTNDFWSEKLVMFNVRRDAKLHDTYSN